MPTEWIAEKFEFGEVSGLVVVAGFDGGAITSDAGALLLQRVVGIALGYEDLIDHDQLRHDPVLAVLAGKLAARRAGCVPLAGKSTLNRLELSRPDATRYHRIGHDPEAVAALFVDLFLDAHRKPPAHHPADAGGSGARCDPRR